MNFEEIKKDSLTTVVTGQIDQEIYNKLGMMISQNYFYGNLTFEKFNQLKSDSRIASVTRQISTITEDGIFPDKQDGKPSNYNNWNRDNMGPIYIPEAGKTVTLTRENLPFYKKVISEYEGNKLEVSENEIKILKQLIQVQGKEVDLGGYYKPDLITSNKIMKPSPIFNEIINNLYSVN